MYCSYHPSNSGRVRCTSCTRSLCAACDHRIKGYAYCQDCIVLGIESLSRNYYSANSKSKARIAALCALLPGLGAVYNRQNVKAVVHFFAVVGLFQLSDVGVLEALFALGGTAFYFYSIIDAYRTAQLISRGESPAIDEERFKRKLIKQAPAIGVGLIAVGLLAVIQLAHPLGMYVSVARLLPVALIILGGYLLTSYFKRSREADYRPGYTERPQFSLVSGASTDPDGLSAGKMSRRKER